jgi:putative hydrolase of the HAD superfamily
MESHLPKAILLDLDDTILDDSGNIAECWRAACVEHRSAFGTVEAESLYECIERTRSWYWSDRARHREGRLDLRAARREVVRLALEAVGIESASLAETIGDTYGARRHRGMRAIEDSIETVRWFRESGCRLALLTNGNADGQREKIERFQLPDLFHAIFIEGELGFGRPDPRVYRLGLEALGTHPGDTWMVGDNLEWDVVGPQRLGIYGIWIDARDQGLPQGSSARPDRIIGRLAHLRDPA